MLRGELSTLSLGMFGKCEWWSVLEPKCVCGWVEGFGGSSCIFVGTFFLIIYRAEVLRWIMVFSCQPQGKARTCQNFTSVEIPDK